MPVTKFSVRTFASVLFTLVLSAGSSFAQSLPSGWSTSDVGSVGATGSAQGATTVTVNGAGADIWGTADAFRFAYTTLTGDGSIITQVTSLENVNAWTKAGVMMRDTLAANAKQALALVSVGKGLAFQRRTATGGQSTNTAGGNGLAPYYVKLTRAGSTFTASKSTNGSTWTTIGSDTISMGSTIYVGVAVSSHVYGNLATASFGSTAVTKTTTPVTTPTVQSSSLTTLRILHWNSHHGGVGTDGVYSPARFISTVLKASPDVVSFNEVENQDELDALIAQLKSQTGKDWKYSYDGRGNVVATRLSVTTDSICMVNPGADRKGAHLSMLVNGRALNMWSVHLALDSSAVRVGEVAAVNGCEQNWPEGHIVAGDFNTQYYSDEILAMSQTHFDAWPTANAMGTATHYMSCDGCTKNSRIDYVFASKAATYLTMKSVQVIDTRDASGVMPSDHKPMLVVYNVK